MARRKAAKQRARRPGPREPNGQLQRATVAEIKSVAHQYRRKLGAHSGNVESANWESALGRAFERGQIEYHHLLAGKQYQSIAVSFARIKGIPSPFPRSVELIAELRGAQGSDLDEAIVRRIVKSMQDSFVALNDCGRPTSSVVNTVVKDDVDCGPWPESNLGMLRDGLEALAVFFQISRGSEEKGVDAA